MNRTIYVVQAFSRDAAGTLRRDVPSFSADRLFAQHLAESLGRRKTGLIAAGITLDETGSLAGEAEIVAAIGILPTALVLPSLAAEASRLVEAETEPLRRSA